MSRQALFPKRWVVNAAVLVGAISCGPAGQRLLVGAGGEPKLAPREAEQGSNPATLEVLFATPQGDVAGQPEIAVSFSMPMKDIGKADDDPSVNGTVPFKVKPPIDGEFRWMGSRTVHLAPNSPIAQATRYEVTVPSGLACLTGHVLEEPYEFSFTTSPPSVATTVPYSQEQWARPDTHIELYFNQSMDPALVKSSARLIVEGKDVPFSVEARDPKDPKSVVVVPASELPLDAAVRLILEKGLVGTEGPLPMTAPFQLDFRTYGPLSVKRISCWGDDDTTPALECDPEDRVSIELTNAIPTSKLEKLVTIKPAQADASFDKWMEVNRWVDITPSTHWKPGSSFTIALGPDLEDMFGQKIQGQRKFEVLTKDFYPRWIMKFDGDLLEANGSRILPVSVLNHDKLDVYLHRVDSEKDVVLFLERLDAEGSEWVEKLDGTVHRTLAFPKVRNKSVLAKVDLDQAKGKPAGGLVFVKIEDPAEDFDWDTRVIRISSLAMTVKISGDRVVAWVTDLATGAPRGGATVTIRDRDNATLWTGTTDASGLVSVAGNQLWDDWYALGWEDRCPYVFAASGGDFNYVNACGTDSISPWSFDVSMDPLAGMKSLSGLVFTDRGAYRPGEEVSLKSIVRYQEKGRMSVPAGEIFTVLVKDSRGEKVFDEKVKVNGYGGLDVKVPLGPASSLGYYSVNVGPDAAGEGRLTLYGSFRVEEYHPPSFAVHVDASKPEVTRGTDAKFSASGDYLFGAPMSGAGVSWFATAQPGWFDPPAWDDFSFSDDSYITDDGWEDPYYELSHSGNGTLGPSGSFGFGFGTDIEIMDGPVDFTVESTVTGPDMQVVSGRTRLRVHPADVYAGVLADSTFLSAGEKIEASAVVVDLGGQPVSGRPVKLDLVRRQWKYVQSQGMHEDSYGEWEAEDTGVATCKKKSGTGPVKCQFSIPAAGRYILRVTTTDKEGRSTASSIGLWATGAGDVFWEGSDELVVDLHPDREEYAVGDTARILVENPFEEAEALVTVEHHGIRDVSVMHFTDRAATIDVPIAEDMRPNVFVSVALVRGRVSSAPKLGGPDPGRPAVRMGYANLQVGIEDRSLKVEVASDEVRYGPQDKVDVTLDVRDMAGQGKKAEVTLFVVDEAVLMLTGYEAPDPLGHFYRPRELGVRNADSRMSVLTRRAFGTEKGEVGGGGWGEEESGSDIRQDFRTTVLFVPDLETDAQGKASASFVLPDGLTTYRIMAVASTKDDCFGRGNASIKVSKPLLLKPALPRFLRVGDRFEAGVILHDGGAGGGLVAVEAKAEGLVLDGDSKISVELPAGGSMPVRFAFIADHAGEAVLTFDARMGDDTDAIRLTRPVILPTVVETVATYGETESQSIEGLGSLTGIREDSGGLTVRMSSTALVGLDRAVENLVRYPYGCAEQLTSRMVPMVALGELLAAFDVGVELDEKRLQATVNQLEQMQHYSGGWGYFAGASCPYPWLSAYVLWGLDQARQRGYVVDDYVMSTGSSYLERVLRDEHWCADMPSWWWSEVGISTKAYILWVLASMDHDMPSYADHLYEKKDALPLFSRLLLADAIHLMGGDQGRIDDLMRDALNGVKQSASSAHLVENLGDGYEMIMHSELRSTAMALWVLLDVEPDHVLVPKMARWLMDARREDGTWGNTQNDAWALLALARYVSVREAETPDFVAKVLVAGRSLMEATFEGRELEEQTGFVAMSDLLAGGPGDVVFAKDGAGLLYYAASLTYARDKLPTEPIDRGFWVEREYYLMGPGGPSPLPAGHDLGEVDAGASVLVKLTLVVTGKRHFVAVEDPLPAGLEPVNLSFSTASMMEAWQLAEVNGPWWSQPFYHTELHDDRVVLFADSLQPGIYSYGYLARATTPGSFVVAPAKAHEMYHPEVFGRTASGAFTVAP